MTRTLPYDEQAERTVIGSCLLAPHRAIPDTRQIVHPDDFYTQTLGRWYQTLLDLHDQEHPIEPALFANHLHLDTRQKAKLVEIVADTTATGNAAHYAQIVHADARRRNIIQAATELRQAAYNGGLQDHPDLTERIQTILDHAPRGQAAQPLNLNELLAGPPPETDWLWNGWIAWEDISLIVGDPKTGKSLLALGLATTARTGGTFLNETVAQANVGIFDLENPLGEVHKRLRRVGLTHDNHHGITYLHTPNMNLSTTDGVAQLNATIDQHNLDLIIIDSFRRAAPGVDENDSAAISAFFAPLRRITAGKRRTIIVIHHARKRTGGDQDTDPAQMTRGSGDFLAAIDSQLYLRRKEPGSFTLKHGANRRGLEHDSIVVRISPAENTTLTFTNEGKAVAVDEKREQLLERVIAALKDAGGGPLARPVLALKAGSNTKDGSLKRALQLGLDRNILACEQPSNPTKPQLWALAPEHWETPE